MLVLVQAAHSCGSPSSPIFLHPASASSRSKEQPSTIPGEKRAQFSPFLCLQVFCSIWPRSLGFLANSNSFCHLLSFPFSRERKNENQMVLRCSSNLLSPQLQQPSLESQEPLLVDAKRNCFFPKNIQRNAGCAVKYVSTWKTLHFLCLLQPHQPRLSAKEE